MSIAGVEIEMSGHAETGMGLMDPGPQPEYEGFPFLAQGDVPPCVQPTSASFRVSWQSQLASLLIGMAHAGNVSNVPPGMPTVASETSALASQSLPVQTPAVLLVSVSSPGF